MTSPGWYQDPDGSGWRWWDGTAWGQLHQADLDRNTLRSARPTGLAGFGVVDLGIDFTSGWAARLTRVVAVGAGGAAVVAGAVLVYSFVVGPIPGAIAPVLLLPAVLLLVLGQLLTIGILIGRGAARRRAASGNFQWWRSGARMRDIRGGLPWPALVVAGLLRLKRVGR